MILPIYDNIYKQQFRQFYGRNDLLNQVKYFSRSNCLPAFQHVFDSLTDNYVSTIVYIDDCGNEISRQEIPEDYFLLKSYLGKRLLIGYGEKLGFELAHCRYYIEIIDASKSYYSEIITRQSNFEAKGLILLNTGAYLLNNSGGGFLLNDSEGANYLQPLVKITATSSKNFSNFDLRNFTLELFFDADIYLDNQYQADVSKEYSGLKKYFQRTLQSVYVMKFYAVRSIIDNIDRLAFFDSVTITDKYGVEHEATDRLEISHERIDTSGVYEVTITYKTQYDYDFQIYEQTDTNMNAADVGTIFHIPALIGSSDMLNVKNNYLTGTGYKYIMCEGQTLDPNSHPVLASILGTVNIGGEDMIQIPDMQAKILISAGTSTDQNAESKTVSSGVADSDGEFSHQLSREEMYHFHVIGGQKDIRSALFRKNQLSVTRDVTGMTEYDGDTLDFNDFIKRETTVFSANVTSERKYVTTLNDNDAAVATSRLGHNNCQPAIGAYAIMFIDDPTNS